MDSSEDSSQLTVGKKKFNVHLIVCLLLSNYVDLTKGSGAIQESQLNEHFVKL